MHRTPGTILNNELKFKQNIISLFPYRLAEEGETLEHHYLPVSTTKESLYPASHDRYHQSRDLLGTTSRHVIHLTCSLVNHISWYNSFTYPCSLLNQESNIT
ncbi:hypothetical protein VIGAN_01000300 [Vigna angularis var. angularis]|uniref:Uncharacterized protein n=1 Tax=Vigna angularis var. angularis TaxID=157739 RepID=A0A0S3QW84_PHAAN|nr:hypothetical protein VIGAN_01000300 [Vigna angularis var. angularis]